MEDDILRLDLTPADADAVSAERQRQASEHGAYVRVEHLTINGVAGDYIRYRVLLLASRQISVQELSGVLAGFERPLPSAPRERRKTELD